MPDPATIEVHNRDGSTHRVNGAKFAAMQAALMAVLPSDPPGMTVAEAKAALLRHLDPVLFPGGDTAGWWLKAVQLDHEFRGLIGRADRPPVRLYRL